MDGRRGRPTTAPEQQRKHRVQVTLTAAEKAAALRLSGPLPLATWAYALIRAELEKEAGR